MEAVRAVLSAIQHQDWMVTVNLKDAYLQVPVHPTSRRFLHYGWKNRIIPFKVLYFGFSTAPQVFTRNMAPLAVELHRREIRIHQYLDEWLLLASSHQETIDSTQLLLRLCAQLGIRINFEKFCLHPAQEMVYLGVGIQSIPLKAFPMWARVDNILSLLQDFLDSRHPTAKEWQTLLGHMASLFHLVPGAQLRMRSLQLRLRSQWSSSTHAEATRISWTPDNLADLQW